MVLWGDHTGKPLSYRGWERVVAGQQNVTKLGLTAALYKLLGWSQDYMSVDTVTLLIPVADQQNLAVQASIGLEEEIKQKIRIPIGKGVAGSICATMEPLIINDMSTAEIVSPVLRHKKLQTLVGIPLIFEQGVTGVLHVGRLNGNEFTQRDVQQLELIANCLSFFPFPQFV